MTIVTTAEQGSAAAASPRWDSMSILGKISFFGKLVMFVCTFGFAFPRLLTN